MKYLIGFVIGLALIPGYWLVKMTTSFEAGQLQYTCVDGYLPDCHPGQFIRYYIDFYD